MPMSQGSVRTIFFFGRPGSGKETQAQLLAEKTGYTIVSTGEKFRELRQRTDALGAKVREEYDAGRLMPDWFADFLFKEAVLQITSDAGVIFEGSARSLEQARKVHDMLSWMGRSYVVLNLNITEDVATKRLLNRGRDSIDTEARIRGRLVEYHELTDPTLEFFKEKSRLITIDGDQSIGEVHRAVCAALHLP